jgi:hypothetical protein
LIEAVNRVGIQNISLLSRMTGMPTETVRYTVKKRFPTMGLNIRTPMNHGLMGLERYFISLNFSNSAKSSAPAILETLSSSAFLTYWCKDAIGSRYLTFFSIPVSFADEHRRFLDRLKDEDILVDYRTERLEWSRHPELKSRYYDFGKGTWSINWDEIKRQGEAPPSLPSIEEPSPLPDIDVTDTLIIKELQLDSWRNIAEIARKLKVNDRTLRWHYRKHVAPIATSSYVSWLPVTKKGIARAAGLIYEFNGITKDTLKELRFFFNNFPFAWFEAGRQDGYYQVHSAVPADFMMESLRFLNSSIADAIDKSTIWTTDLSTSHWYTMPYENFDNKKGWFFEQDDVLKKILPQKMKVRERRT